MLARATKAGAAGVDGRQWSLVNSTPELSQERSWRVFTLDW